MQDTRPNANEAGTRWAKAYEPMSLNFQYREYLPPQLMAPFVECFWTLKVPQAPDGGFAPHRVVPDGCIDIILRMNQTAGVVDASLTGAMTRPILAGLRSGEEFAAVRFRPGGAFAVLGRPMWEFTDRDIPIAAFWRRSNVEHLCETVAAASSGPAKVEALQVALAAFCGTVTGAALWLPSTLRALSENCSDSSLIETLCSQLGVSRQHLARVFKEQVGLRPKQLARIIRLRRLLTRAGQIQHTERNWCSLAAEFGYYDQAHLISECRQLTGLTPTRYFAHQT